MLYPFAGTQAPASSRAAWSSSIVIHVLLLAIVVSAPSAKVSRDSGDVVPREASRVRERVRYVVAGNASGWSEREAPKRAVRRGPSVAPVMHAIGAPRVDLAAIPGSPALPDIDLRSRTREPDDFAPMHAAELVKTLVPASSPPPPRADEHWGPYSKADVDKGVLPFANNPIPEYPRRLQRAGVEGSFVVQFVVDSTGRAVGESMVFLSDVNPLFIRAVRRALLGSGYYPAEVGGKKVEQLVEQKFSFVLVGGRKED